LRVVRDELQPQYKGRLFIDHYNLERVGCFGGTYPDQICDAILEECPPVEKKYLFGLASRQEKSSRTVVAVRYDRGFDPLFVDVTDEGARDVVRRHLEPFAQEMDKTIGFTYEPDCVERITRELMKKLDVK